MECFIGIDLAVRSGKCSGIAVYLNGECFVTCSFSIDELLKLLKEIIRECGKCVVAIDAPLTVSHHGFREVDKKLISMGFKVLPPSFPGMRKLTEAAIEIANELRSRGCIVIETHPRSALASSKCLDVKDLENALSLECSYDQSYIDRWLKDMNDAVIALATALCFVKGCVEVVQAADGEIVLLNKLC